MRKRAPRPGEGRPTKYKHEYCDMLVEHMSKGLSFESFAATIQVHDGTLRDWEAKFPEFAVAKKNGYAHCRIYWEKVGAGGMLGKIPGFNATVWIFSMKNRFRWADRVEATQDISLTLPQVVFKTDDTEDEN